MNDVGFEKMSAANAVNQVAARVAAGITTEFDAEILEIFGTKLSKSLATNIRLGLATEENVNDVWDAAFYSGSI